MSEVKKADTITVLDSCRIKEVVVCDERMDNVLEFISSDGGILMKCGNERMSFDHCRFAEFIIKLSDLDWESNKCE